MFLELVGPMIRRVNTRYFFLVFLFFTLCQVIGTVCPLPDLSVAEETAILVEEGMTCPMDVTMMCPPSATSSPMRQVKNSASMDADQTSAFPSVLRILTNPSAEPQWTWSSDFSIVPISIGSSSVLRI